MRPGAADTVSEVDLSDARDLCATLEPMPALGLLQSEGENPVLVHFGDTDFTNEFRTFVENISQWRASAGAGCCNPENRPATQRPAKTFRRRSPIAINIW